MNVLKGCPLKTHQGRSRSRGANVPKAMEPLKVINSQGEGPYTVLTHLGWTINGPLGSAAPMDEHGQPRIMSNKISVVKLEELLVYQYNQDFSEWAYNEKQEHSFEDKKFLHVMKSSVKRKDGNFEIRLPFCQDNISLPNNRKMVEQRALSLARRFQKDETFRKDYNGFMSDVLRKGHAERVPGEQLEELEECGTFLAMVSTTKEKRQSG